MFYVNLTTFLMMMTHLNISSLPYDVIDLLNSDIFQGLPGLELDF